MPNQNIDTPHFVSSHDFHGDADYIAWLSELKTRYQHIRSRIALQANYGMLEFNWLLGRDLVEKKAEQRWGAGVVEQLSLDMRAEYPDIKGFSSRNLWYMKQWYLFYFTEDEKPFLHQVDAEIQKLENQYSAKLYRIGRELQEEKMHQLGAEFPLPFALVPWRHHVEIITKCKSKDEALFYLGKTIEQGLSREALINCIKANLYEHQGKIANNFNDHLPALQSKLIQEVLKENYDFGFATVEHEIYNEDEMEKALTQNITDLLLEMGTGFAFIGKQKEIIVGGHSRKIDLLFYHMDQGRVAYQRTIEGTNGATPKRDAKDKAADE